MSRRRNPRGYRPVHGIVLLDKPQGLSSNHALQRVRRLYQAEKAGHTGALDPLATGMLPVCLGEATKIAGLLLGCDKAYLARIRLGAATDTEDAEGEVIARAPVPALDADLLRRVLEGFVGEISQVPPRYSALKRDGVPLYKRARRGEDFEVPARRVQIRRIDLLDHGVDWLEIRVECGTGTYIRSLARDVGEALGCGGHIEALRRLWVGPFRDLPMHTLESLEDEAERKTALLGLEAGLSQQRHFTLEDEMVARLRQGQRLPVQAAPGEVVVMDVRGQAVALAEISAEGVLRPRRLFVHFEAEAAGD